MDRPTNDVEKKKIHCGHRERCKKRFLSGFGNDMADHELLELLLFFAIPRVNTNETAHLLIEKFGSLEQVFAADYEDLITVNGCKRSSAILIKTVSAIIIRLNRNSITNKKKFASLREVGEYLTAYYRGLGEEHFCLMFFDINMRLIDFCEISKGNASGAPADPKTIARLAVNKNAAIAIISHNHLSGHTLPSSADKELTHRIDAALSAIGVFLLDHIIVSGNAYSSTMIQRYSKSGSHWANCDVDENFIKEFYFE